MMFPLPIMALFIVELFIISFAYWSLFIAFCLLCILFISDSSSNSEGGQSAAAGARGDDDNVSDGENEHQANGNFSLHNVFV